MGHMAIAQMALEKFGLAKVIFIPSNQPPHKKIMNLASCENRLKMVRLAVQDNPLFEVSDFEIRRKCKSYTIDTAKHLCSVYPKKTKFFFIVGGDSFSDLGSWKCIDEILQLASFIVVNRPGYTAPRRKRKIKHYSVIMPGIDISSSYLRNRIRQGKSVKYFVPDKVLKYVQQNKLYQR